MATNSKHINSLSAIYRKNTQHINRMDTYHSQHFYISSFPILYSYINFPSYQKLFTYFYKLFSTWHYFAHVLRCLYHKRYNFSQLSIFTTFTDYFFIIVTSFFVIFTPTSIVKFICGSIPLVCTRFLSNTGKLLAP